MIVITTLDRINLKFKGDNRFKVFFNPILALAKDEIEYIYYLIEIRILLYDLILEMIL